MVETRKSKVPAVRVASDDCEVRVGRVVQDGIIVNEGTPYRVHEGEWVEIVPVQSMKEQLALSALVSITGPGDDARMVAQQIGGPLTTLCTELSKRVLTWNWTDNDSNALPSPYRHPEVIEALSNDEVLWLLTAAQGETGAQRKNGFMP